MYIKQIKIKNYKSLKSLDLTFPSSKIEDKDNKYKCSLTIITGENGTYKSTIFQLLKDKLELSQKINTSQFEEKKSNVYFDISYNIDGNDYSINSEKIINNAILPHNVVLSTYSRIDKLEYYFDGKPSIYNDKILKLSNRIAINLAGNKFENIAFLIEAIEFKVSDLYFEASEYRLNYKTRILNYVDKNIGKVNKLRASNLAKFDELVSEVVGEELSLEYNDCKKNLKSKSVEYSDILMEASKSLDNPFRRPERTIQKFLDASEIAINLIDKNSNYSLKLREKYNILSIYLKVIFILSKFKLLFLDVELKTGEHKSVKSNRLFSQREFIKYNKLYNNTLENDLKFLVDLEIEVFTDLWFNKDFKESSNLPEVVPMSLLSSGEISLFIRLYDLLEEVKDNSLVLIDEPETHLHPKWIQNYIKTLLKLIGHKRCHIIISTHSPIIVSSIPSQSLVGLKKEKNIIEQIDIYEKTLGLNYDDIIQNIFSVTSNNDMEKTYIELTRQHLKNNNFNDALKVYSKLSNSLEKYNLFIEIEEMKKNINRG